MDETTSYATLKDWAAFAWETGKNRLFDTKTNLFYDFVSDYDPDHRFDHLPTPEEIQRQYPNPNGWRTGMEDSTINGGVMLACLCDRHIAAGEQHLAQEAAQVYEGLKLCGTKSSSPGLVLRSISPFDGTSYFIETSRDQLTHFAHGLWRFFHSPLSNTTQRDEMAEMMVQLSRRLEQRVIPENDYHFGREDGTPGLPDQMWGRASPHESPRLPMIYLVTWDMTGDSHWHELYRTYAWEAVEHAAELNLNKVPERPCYGLFQHQYAMEALAGIESEDTALRTRWREEMNRIADVMSAYSRKFHNYHPVDVREVNRDFRTQPSMESKKVRLQASGAAYGHVAEWSDDMRYGETTPLRELGESLLIRLVAPESALTEEQETLLAKGLTSVNYDLLFSYAMLYPQAAFWRYAANQMNP